MDQALRSVQGSWRHALTFALRYDDHFLRVPVEETLDVTALSPAQQEIFPVSSQAGSYRHADGTYRFIDLRDGNYGIAARSRTGLWVSWDPPLSLAAPLAQPSSPIARELWPTPAAGVAPGMTAVRGKLLGTSIQRLKVEIAASAGGVFDRFNCADSAGEFLFPVALRVKPENDGRIKLKVRVAGGSRVVNSIDVSNPSGSTVDHFVGVDFLVAPGRVSRVKLNVA